MSCRYINSSLLKKQNITISNVNRCSFNCAPIKQYRLFFNLPSLCSPTLASGDTDESNRLHSVFHKPISDLSFHLWTPEVRRDCSFQFADVTGKRVVLVTNVATMDPRLSSTQLYGMRQLQLRYGRDTRLAIVAVPSHDFGQTEIQDDRTIREILAREYGMEIREEINDTDGCPIFMAHSTHISPQQYDTPVHPFFRKAFEDLGQEAIPKGNFYKYIVDKNGEMHSYFAPHSSMTDHRVIQTLNQLIEEDVK